MVRPTGFDVEPVISTKVVPRFDGTEDGYWWLIQLDRYFEANTWLVEERKVGWVTAMAFSGDAFSWWCNCKQGNQNITWEAFERAFIKKFIPDMWEMLETAKCEEQENHEYVLNETGENKEESMEVRNKTDSGLMQNSSEQSDQKFPTTTTEIPSVMEFSAQQNSECHKKPVTESYVLFETETLEKMKIKWLEEATTTVEDPNLEEDISQTRGDQMIVLDPEPPPEPPDNGHRVVSIKQPETLDGESRKAIGLSMTISLPPSTKLPSLPTVGKKVVLLMKSVNEVMWRMAQFVFDRGKVLMEANPNLEDKVVLKGWVLIETKYE
ncbi:unnamed protein product [Trifolium pratense]|uniref:Uncharacterized protein n=1 Tax=Trifolium pratense TaxID=57577 RepID=A0ACB0L8B4_TRIPR|nr:unnamed protein product [Trifolium pratense]